VIQLGKRNTIFTLLAVAALSISADALAQPAPPANPPADPNAPPPNPPPAENPTPTVAPTPAPAPIPPPTAPAEPAKPPPTYPTMSGPLGLRLGDLFTIRPGFFMQFYLAAAQDALPKVDGSDGGFAKNIYLRRARFLIYGGIGKEQNLTYFMLWETANLGLATLNADGSVNKNFLTYNFNDAYLDYKINPNVSIQAGLLLIPFTRNIFQSTATYWTIDIGAVSASYINATQTSTLRDTGVEVKVNAAENHFEARGMVSQGVKIGDPEGGGRSPGKNDPRFSAYAQYNFLEPEAGYVFNGQYFGRKAVAGVAVGGDYQNIKGENPYFATSATAYASIPLNGADPKNGGDEVGGQVEYLHFHGGGAGSPAALGKRNGLLVEAGYYNKDAKLSVFGKFEGVFLEGNNALMLPNNILDTRLFGGGIKYFFAESLFNLTLQYNFTQFPNQDSNTPAALKRNNTSLIQLMLQLGYF